MGDVPLVECRQLALGDESGTARLFVSAADSSTSSLHPETFAISQMRSTESYEVTVDTLDRVADRLGIGRIDLLKIDVEGHELAVLNGARELLGRGALRMIQFEFGERNLASRTFLRDFVDLLGDYQVLRLTPHGLRRLSYGPADEVFLLEAHYVARRRPPAELASPLRGT